MNLQIDSYENIKNQIKPFDLIFFKGGEIISKGIRLIQKTMLGIENKKDVWSHVGIVVTKELFDDPRILPNKLYISESTLSGKLADGIKNIDNKAFFGVQIRELDLLVQKYANKGINSVNIQADKPVTNDCNKEKRNKKKNNREKSTAIGWARMKDNPFRDMSEKGMIKQQKIRDQFTILYPNRWEGMQYDINLISLAASVFPIFRPIDWLIKKINLFNTDDWLFCSEYVFDILQVFKFYDKRIDGSFVLPNDLLGYDNSTPSVPSLFDSPVTLFTS